MLNAVSNHLTINAQLVPEPTPLSFNIFFHMMPYGMKYLFKQVRSSVWFCPLPAPCSPTASLLAAQF